jgi:hypothetical protein
MRRESWTVIGGWSLIDKGRYLSAPNLFAQSRLL